MLKHVCKLSIAPDIASTGLSNVKVVVTLYGLVGQELC